MKKRKTYSKEFKLEALNLAKDVGVRKAGDDLGVDVSLLSKWKKTVKIEGKDAFRGHGRRTEQNEELRRLRQENRTLKQEREILKKAASFFASLHR